MNIFITNQEIKIFSQILQSELSIAVDLLEQILDSESLNLKNYLNEKIIEILNQNNSIELTRFITNKMLNSNYIESIYIFLPNFETFTSTHNQKINMKDIPIFDEFLSTKENPKIWRQPLKSIISNSVVIPVTNKINTASGVFYIYAELSLTKICEKNIANKTIGLTGYLALNDDKGINLFHKDRSIVLTSFSHLDFMQNMINSKKDFDIIEYTFKGEKEILAYQKFKTFPIYGTATESKKAIENIALTYVKNIILFLISSLTILIVTAIIFTNKTIIRHIIRLIEPIQKIANGDLRANFPVSTRDEIGHIAKKLNFLLESLNILIKNVKDKAKNLNEISLNLASNMEETAAAIHEINKNIENSKQQIEEQVTSVTQTSAAVEQLTRSIDSLNQIIEDQAANITESSSAIEEMVSNIASVALNADNSQKNAEELLKISNEGKKSLDDVFITIKEISKMSENLIATTSLIMSIADKTNLLAMNAAIEAAHAGEFGKGFAVVADEIRKLSEQTASQSKSITQNLNQIKNAIDKVANTSKETSEVFSIILQKIASVNKMAEEIKVSMDEQKEGSKQILEALRKMNQITSSVKNSSAEMKSGNNEILSAIKKLNQVSYNVKNSNTEIFTALNEINKAIANVTKLANLTRNETANLVESTEKFIVKEDIKSEKSKISLNKKEKFEALPGETKIEDEVKGINTIEE